MKRLPWTARHGRAVICCALWAVSGMATAQAIDKISRFEATARDGFKLPVEVTLPASGEVRAVVVVVPGSGGLQDPYFDAESAKPNYDPQHRGGLTSALLDAGFGVAAFSERGYRELRLCMAGGVEASPARRFVDQCIDQEVRSTVDLDTLSRDTQSILEQTKGRPELSGMPLLVLAFSEGLYHTARSNELHSLDVAGIVSVGGPFDSIADTARYQVEHQAFLSVARRAFANCPRSSMDASALLACAGMPPSPAWIDGLLKTMATATINKSDIEARATYWKQQYRTGRSFFVNRPPIGALAADFEGVPIARNWAAAYYTQFLQATARPLAMLQGFQGRVHFLFGGLDQFVRIPSGAEVSAEGSKDHVAADMTVQPLVNHGLADESGMPSSEALNAIVSALRSVLVPSVIGR